MSGEPARLERFMQRFLKRARDGEPAAEAAAEPAAEAKEENDLEQQIVDYVVSRAEFGHRGRINTRGSSRKVLLLGKPYYWENPALALTDLPPYFTEFATKHSVATFNSILCNVYLEQGSKISPHADNTSLLQPGKGEVRSISLAIHRRDRDRRLAKMVFTQGGVSEHKELYHETCVAFDAFQDASRRRLHEVRSTERPRVNLTYRHLK